jgi:hypothetical protein
MTLTCSGGCCYEMCLVDYILFHHIGVHCNNTLQCIQLSSLKCLIASTLLFIYLFIYLFCTQKYCV